MRMTHKGNAPVESRQAPADIGEQKQVLPLLRLDRIGVCEGPVVFHVAIGKGLQIVEFVVRNHLARSENGVTSQRIERPSLATVDQGFVVIAQDTDDARLSQPVDAGHGIGAVSDNVSQNDEVLGAGLLGGDEHGLKRLQVGVDISENGQLH